MARIAFFGTPTFSVPSLRAVHRFCERAGHELVLVVTQADQKQGRGQKMLAPPVKSVALELSLPVVQPLTLRKNTPDGDEFYEQLTALNVDLAVVVAYGKILSERVLSCSRRGFVNVHASLLPRFRGAAPIQRALEHGDRETGVCLMDVVKGLDEGDIYAVSTTPIIPSDTSATLFRRLSNLGAVLLEANLTALLAGSLPKKPQGNEGVIYADMIHKEEARLDFNESCAVLSRRVRAFDPAPGAFLFVRNRRVKLFDSFYVKVPTKMAPGTILTNNPFLGITTVDGVIYFQTIQVEGKRALPVREALLGFDLAVGENLYS